MLLIDALNVAVLLNRGINHFKKQFVFSKLNFYVIMGGDFV
jgi:hypothetical protein